MCDRIYSESASPVWIRKEVTVLHCTSFCHTPSSLPEKRSNAVALITSDINVWMLHTKKQTGG